MEVKTINILKIGECYLDKVQYNEENVKVTITYIFPGKKYYGKNSAYHIPLKEKSKTINISDWAELDDIKNVSLAQLKELLVQNIKGIDVQTVMVTSKIMALKINWNNIKIRLVEDDASMIRNKRSPIPIRVLLLLEERPNYIVKGRYGFVNRLGLNFIEHERVVYVGEGATYYFDERGYDYIGLSKLRQFRKSKCKNLIGIVEHREKDNTREKLMQKTEMFLYS